MSEPPADAPLSPGEAERLARDAMEAGRLERSPALRLGRQLAADARLVAAVAEVAAEAKRRWLGDVVSVSRNVFLPLTNLCRDRCSYCTFAKRPGDPGAKTYTLDEVAAVCDSARRAGCIEALFCLGDKPELAFPSYRTWLAAQGHATTAEYLVEACRVAVEHGMLPHTNAGLLTQAQMAALRPWNASMGLMLETVSERLLQRGGAHHAAPDKHPELRLRMHREAGELGIPFTTGLLLGIGETADERVDTLFAIRALADRYGHIQEAILQPFHPKTDTKMRGIASPADDDVVAWVALARLVLGPAVHVQAPPNLASGELLERLLRAGIDDLGGVSPVSIDFINPEAPWPALAALRRRTEAAGSVLRERLPAYPEHLLGRPELFEPSLHARALALADREGYALPRQREAEEAA
ncbi:MAG TPA: 7,8-didemethyl-8-hydroxy-5-deazariboflavin synthase CofG [Myxococcota bacterium]|nr:7,8-didemethyl-8-hydroxy-5-deazariboflavin synthase CofG [Myxococcota bacterium]